MTTNVWWISFISVTAAKPTSEVSGRASGVATLGVRTCAGLSGSTVSTPSATRMTTFATGRPNAFGSDKKIVVPKRGRKAAFLFAARLRSNA